MSRDTSTARAVRSVKGDYDAACKRLLAEKQVLSRVMHDWLREFSTIEPTEIEQRCFEGEPRVGEDLVDRDERAASTVRSLSQEDVTLSEGITTFDVRFEAWAPVRSTLENGKGELVRVELDVEAQNDFYPGYPLLRRGVFYGGRLLSMQGGTVIPGSHYERVRKAVSIWVCTHPPRKYAGTVTSFALRPEHILGDASFMRDDYDLLQVVMACLNDEEPGSSEGALGMLEVLLARGRSANVKLKALRENYGMMVSEEIDERVSAMCNLSEGVYQEGHAVGLKEGREDERKGFLEAAAGLVRGGKLALGEAVESFGFTEDELRTAVKRQAGS